MVNNKKTCSFEQLLVIKLLRVLDLQNVVRIIQGPHITQAQLPY